jgi:hypothetical protein
MEIKLTPKESEDFFHTALCNGLGYISGHGLELFVDEDKYRKAKQTLQEQGIPSNCYEDVLMQVLRQGDALTLVDEEGGDYTADITLDMVHTRVSNVFPVRHLLDMYNENDDAETADVIIQYVAYNDIIFG